MTLKNTPLKFRTILSPNTPHHHVHNLPLELSLSSHTSQDNKFSIQNILVDDSSLYLSPVTKNWNVSLECTNRFVLTKIQIRVPCHKTTEEGRSPVRNGLIFVSNVRIDVEDTEKYNDITRGGFALIKGRPGAPIRYFKFKEGESSLNITLKEPPTGRFILIKFLSTRNGDADRLAELEYLDFIGDIIEDIPPPAPIFPADAATSEESEDILAALPDDEPTNAQSSSDTEDDEEKKENISSIVNIRSSSRKRHRLAHSRKKSKRYLARLVHSHSSSMSEMQSEDLADNAQSCSSSPGSSP